MKHWTSLHSWKLFSSTRLYVTNTGTAEKCQKRKAERGLEVVGRVKVGNGSTPYLALEGLEELQKAPKVVRDVMK